MQRRSLLAAAPAIALIIPARAAPTDPTRKPMIVSSGGAGGTYFRLMQEFDRVCPGLIINTTSDGSLTNIDMVLGNQAELGISQFDALRLRGDKEKTLKDSIRILLPLHPEEIHFLAKSAPRSEGGIGPFNFNAKAVYLNSVDDLRGRKLGFWGGAVVTEQLFTSMALTGWIPVEYPDQKEALDALKNDQVDALLAVGGQPLKWVSDLSRDYKLLEVSDSLAKRLDAVYDRTTLAYRNLGQDGIQALSVQAMLITRNYKSKSKHDQLQMIHDKLAGAIDDIRETRGTHPKWRDIDPNARTDKWPMYLEPAQ